MKCVEVYKELYHQEPFDVAFCPYRISPLGAHIDHQYGKINGLAIDKGIHMASQQARFCAHLMHCEKRKINVYSSI